jgi:hypothetical protein
MQSAGANVQCNLHRFNMNRLDEVRRRLEAWHSLVAQRRPVHSATVLTWPSLLPASRLILETCCASGTLVRIRPSESTTMKESHRTCEHYRAGPPAPNRYQPGLWRSFCWPTCLEQTHCMRWSVEIWVTGRARELQARLQTAAGVWCHELTPTCCRSA